MVTVLSPATASLMLAIPQLPILGIPKSSRVTGGLGIGLVEASKIA
jgi:hypothetical protein